MNSTTHNADSSNFFSVVRPCQINLFSAKSSAETIKVCSVRKAQEFFGLPKFWA